MGRFPESALAHELLDGLDGVEIGGSSHNCFSIKNCRNVDWTDAHTLSKEEEVKLCGESLPVDIVADAAALPLADASIDFVISSHQIEHHFDPIACLQEWWRVIRPGGYLFIVVPHRDRCQPDDTMDITTIAELEARHSGKIPVPSDYGPGGYYGHRSFWRTADFLALLEHLGYPVHRWLDVDDKPYLLEWSSICDAPLSCKPWNPPPYATDPRIARVIETGTSLLDNDDNRTPEQIVAWNRAGPNESRLTPHDVIKRYTQREEEKTPQ